MNRIIVNQKTFWISVAVFFVAKLLWVVALILYPKASTELRAADTGMAVVLAMTVGGRFVDFGSKRWVGIVAAISVFAVLPAGMIFAHFLISVLDRSIKMI